MSHSILRIHCAALTLIVLGFGGSLLRASNGPAAVKEALAEPSTTESHPEASVDLNATALRTATLTPSFSAPVRPVEAQKEHFHWGPALAETFFFTSFMHAKRLTDPDTIPELKGPLFLDYFRSVEGLHGWDDHDPFQVQYIGHSFHGATDSRIELQNNPNGRTIDWGQDGYWHSRFVAMAWNALWGAQFKIGPYSEAMIGNVGLPNQYRKQPIPPDSGYGRMAWSEFVVNPVGGTAWVVTEDLLDRYVVERMEGKTNRYFMYLARSFLTPSRTWANMLRFKRPWYREKREIDGRPRRSTK